MPGLTITEKEHWRDRISLRIARAIERVKSRHPALFDRVRRQAHRHALESLGLADSYAELEAAQAEEADLALKKKRAQRAMIAALRGAPLEEVPESFSVRYGCELPLPAEAIGKRQSAHQEQLLAEDPVGREVARLEAEKEHLLDTVWLATIRQPDQPLCYDLLGIAA
jgi:hypothetical protein